MKAHAAEKDSAQQSSKTASRPAASGGPVLSAAPPAYGIGFVDELLTEGPDASAQHAPVLQRQAAASVPPPGAGGLPISRPAAYAWQAQHTPVPLPWPIQAKLEIGAVDDPLEREADRVADAVEQPSVEIALTIDPERTLQRQAHSAGNMGDGSLNVTPAIPGLENDVRLASHGGQPLEPTVRSLMESRIGADFSEVKIHTEPASTQLNRELNSHAFTHGAHIHFADGQYNPHSTAGRHLLAHELAHVVQQGSVPDNDLVRRNGGKEIVYSVQIPDTVKTREDVYRVINLYVFGEDNRTPWIDLRTNHEIDVASVKGTQVRVHLPRDVAEKAISPEVKKQREESKTALLGMKGGEKKGISDEANRRYYQRTGDKPGTEIKKGEEGKSQEWDQALADVLKDKQTLENLPAAMKELMGAEKSYKPADYERLLKIAEKLKNFTPEDLAAYKLLAIRATDNLDLFEKSVDLFLARREELKKALEQQLQQPQQSPTQPTGQEKDLQATLQEKWEDFDEKSFATMSESERYTLARQKAAELTQAQLEYMKQHPGETIKDFAKSAALLNTPETFSAIGKDIQEAANGDANSWARWAAGTGAGAKLSGWLLAVAGVLYVASWFTGIGELATIAAAAGILLGTTLTLSLAESELRIKAASQAKSPEDFKRNIQLSAAARANVIVGVALIVIAVVVRGLAKAFFPETVKKLGTSIKNFRERVRLKGSIYELKPQIRSEMGSLRGELAKQVEAAKTQAAADAAEIEKLSTEEFAAKLDNGSPGTIFDQSKIPPEQKLNYGELLKSPEGRKAIEGYRARLMNALKADVPAEIDRIANEYTSKIDDFLKEVDAAKNHDDLKAAADNIEGSLTEEHAKKFISGEQERITAEKLEQAATEARAEALQAARDAIVRRVRSRIAGADALKLTYTEAELDAIVNKGKQLGLSDRFIEDFIYIGSRVKKAITAADLMQQMDNWVNVVSKRGFPFKFADLASFKQFSRDLAGLVRAIKLPADDIRIQGSALRKPTANDVDIAIFVDESTFDKLLVDKYNGKARFKGNPIPLENKTHAELVKIASDVLNGPRADYNGVARTFARPMLDGLTNSHGEVFPGLKEIQRNLASKYPDLNIETVSLSHKGALFELKPDMPIDTK